MTMTVNPPAAGTGVREPDRVRPKGKANWRRGPGRSAYLFLTALVFFSAFPLYYSLVVASHDNSILGQVPPPLWFGGNLFANIGRAFGEVPMAQALVNSVLVSLTITVSQVFFSVLAGFAFGKLAFRGKNIMLLLIIGTMMVPTQLGIIPLYILMAKFHLIGDVWAVIVPSLVSAFGVFFMSQYLSTAVPTELIEAARADGCTTLRIFWHVVLPAARPAAAVLATLTFMTAWNDFFWPLVVLNPENPTVQTVLSTLSSGRITDASLILTGAAIATVPLLIVFGLLGKHIIGGIMQGAVKG
jgi:cellobiose transport system permease protein